MKIPTVNLDLEVWCAFLIYVYLCVCVSYSVVSYGVPAGEPRHSRGGFPFFLGKHGWNKWMRNKSVTQHSWPKAAAVDLFHA